LKACAVHGKIKVVETVRARCTLRRELKSGSASRIGARPSRKNRSNGDKRHDRKGPPLLEKHAVKAFEQDF